MPTPAQIDRAARDLSRRFCDQFRGLLGRARASGRGLPPREIAHAILSGAIAAAAEVIAPRDLARILKVMAMAVEPADGDGDHGDDGDADDGGGAPPERPN
jgi:hypothetical protein